MNVSPFKISAEVYLSMYVCMYTCNFIASELLSINQFYRCLFMLYRNDNNAFFIEFCYFCLLFYLLFSYSEEHSIFVLILDYFYQFPEERKIDLLKTLAGSSPYSSAQDSRQLLPSVVQLLKVF